MFRHFILFSLCAIVEICLEENDEREVQLLLDDTCILSHARFSCGRARMNCIKVNIRTAMIHIPGGREEFARKCESSIGQNEELAVD